MTALPSVAAGPVAGTARLILAVALGACGGLVLSVAPAAAALAVLAAPAVAAAVIDVRTRRIPNELTAGGVALALVYAAATASLLDASLAMLAALAAGLLLRAAARGGFGMGDVKLLAYGGAAAGLPGLLPLFFATSLAGGAIAIGSLLWHGRRGTTIPYGPAIAVGLVTTLWVLERAG